MKRLGLLILIGYTASAGVAHAATYYVAKSGNNGNSCAQAQSISTAKLTITEGLKCLAAGDTLFVRGGNYNERIDNNIPSGTSWTNKVRIANYNGETVWLQPTSGTIVVWLGGSQSPRYIEIDGINVNATSVSSGAVSLNDQSGGIPTNIRLQNLEIIGSPTTNYYQVLVGGSDHRLLNVTIHGYSTAGCGLACSAYGIYLAASRVVIDGCDIYQVNGGGIHLYRSSAPYPTDNIIRNTKVHEINRSGDDRIFGILVSGTNTQVYNNLVYDIDFPGAKAGEGAIVEGGSSNKIYNNTMANNAATGGLKVHGANTEVRNNIAYNNAGAAVFNGGTGTISTNNIGPGGASGWTDVNPQFVNLSGNDFKLQSDSRAVDAGATLSAVTTDIVGVARPQGRIHDIGAYEFSGQPTASGPPAPPTGVRIVSN